jgi:hypothetical protein
MGTVTFFRFLKKRDCPLLLRNALADRRMLKKFWSSETGAFPKYGKR